MQNLNFQFCENICLFVAKIFEKCYFLRKISLFLCDFDINFTRVLIVTIAISSFVEYSTGMIYTLYLQANQQKYLISIGLK